MSKPVRDALIREILDRCAGKTALCGENEVLGENATEEARAAVGDIAVHLKEDGKALLVGMGSIYDCTWETAGPSKLKILMDGEELYEAVLEDGLMKIESEGFTIALKRAEQ